MQALRFWPFWRVLLVSAGWVSLCLIAAVVWVVLQFTGVGFGSSLGSGGIGFVSVGINVFTLLVPFGPPAVLVVAWTLTRRGRQHTPRA
jgi:hypothetical protein